MTDEVKLTPEQRAEVEAIWAKRLIEIEAEEAAGTSNYEIAGPAEELLAKMERYVDAKFGRQRARD